MMSNRKIDLRKIQVNHDLKVNAEFFDDVVSGRKPFELRKNDRGYEEGHIILLREWDGEKYTGRKKLVLVSYILEGFEGLKEGYCILGIKRLPDELEKELDCFALNQNRLEYQAEREELQDTELWEGDITATIIIGGFGMSRILPNNKLAWREAEAGFKTLTLKEISNQIKQMYPAIDIITVIWEMGLQGYIYQYGNYGDYWVEHGETKGYA